MKEHDDHKILELIEDDKQFDLGFECLVKKYQEPLYWHIRRMVHFHEDADDVLQNVFIKVFKSIRGFKRESKLYTWLYRIATNETITFLNKKKKRDKSVNVDVDLEILETKLKADIYFDAERVNVILTKAIELLPSRQRQVFNLRYYQEMSYNDMSEVLDTSVGSLKASYHHAVKKIEDYLRINI